VRGEFLDALSDCTEPESLEDLSGEGEACSLTSNSCKFFFTPPETLLESDEDGGVLVDNEDGEDDEVCSEL
jgi:hypothetical protein